MKELRQRIEFSRVYTFIYTYTCKYTHIYEVHENTHKYMKYIYIWKNLGKGSLRFDDFELRSCYSTWRAATLEGLQH